MKRSADAVWKGGIKDGDGRITAESGALLAVRYGFTSRFENEAGTNPEAVAALAAALERIGKSPEFKGFLDKQFAASDSFIALKGARAFMERDLGQMKQVVDGLPMHAQYLFDDKHPDELPVGY